MIKVRELRLVHSNSSLNFQYKLRERRSKKKEQAEGFLSQERKSWWKRLWLFEKNLTKNLGRIISALFKVFSWASGWKKNYKDKTCKGSNQKCRERMVWDICFWGIVKGVKASKRKYLSLRAIGPLWELFQAKL